MMPERERQKTQLKFCLTCFAKEEQCSHFHF